jgi:hypothetical protein
MNNYEHLNEREQADAPSCSQAKSRTYPGVKTAEQR